MRESQQSIYPLGPDTTIGRGLKDATLEKDRMAIL